MIKAPNGQNKLVNKIFSVEGLILVIVLTALGLSIAAFAMPCKSKFGAPGDDCSTDVFKCDPGEYCKLDGKLKCDQDNPPKARPGIAHCVAIPGNGVSVGEVECGVDNYSKVSYCEPVCDFEYNGNPDEQPGMCKLAQGIKNCNPSTCCKHGWGDGTCHHGSPTFCNPPTNQGPTGPPPSDPCTKYTDPDSCCQAKSCYFYGEGAREGNCTSDPSMNIPGRSKNCCEGDKYKPDGDLCNWSSPMPPGPPFPPPDSSHGKCETEGLPCEDTEHKTTRCCPHLQCIGGICQKKHSGGGSPPPPPPTIGGGGSGILNPTSSSSPSPGSPSSGSPSPGPPSPGSPSPGPSPPGSTHDNNHLVIIISSIVGVLFLIGFIYAYSGKSPKITK